MYLGLPQIIWVVTMVIGLIIVATKHGEEREGRYDVGVNIVVVFLEIAILAWGGFFSR